MTDPFADVLVFGVDDETVYNWFHDGPGTESTVDACAATWLAVHRGCAEAAGLVAQGLAASTASWSGAAADVAHGAVAAARTWVDSTSEALLHVHDTILAQSSSFNETKAALSPPVVVPDKPWANDLWPGETNYDQALEAKQANNFRNVELMRVYGAVTSANNVSYPNIAGPSAIGRAAADEISTAAPTERTEQPAQPQPVRTPVTPGAERLAVEPPRPGADDSAPVPEIGSTRPTEERRAHEPGADGGHLAGVAASGAGTVTSGVLGAWPPDSPVPGASSADRPVTPREAGGQPGSSGVALGEQVGHRTGTAGARAGAPGSSGVVPGAGSRRDEDDEHDNRFYVMERHEDFWDDNPAVAPPVIGGDDD
jgi:hypothetical protein